MNYYFSGVGDGTGKYIPFGTALVSHRLLSCHGPYVSFAHKWFKDTIAVGRGKQQTILLDSGAFTAWNQGHPTKLQALLPIYHEFVDRYLNNVANIWLINLDKIPGSPGVDPTPAEIDAALDESDRNYEVLVREFGPRVLPVFHQGESNERLAVVEAMADYICLSPRNDLGESLRVRWAREMHTLLPDSKRTHGLATTGFLMMTTVPWTSVDSAAWVSVCSYGGVTVRLVNSLHLLGVTPHSSTRYKEELHVDTLNPQAHQAFKQRVEQLNLGITIDHLRHNLAARLVFTMHEIQDWIDNCYNLNRIPMPTLWSHCA